MLDRLAANDLDAFFQFIYGDLEGWMILAELHRKDGQEYMQHHPYYWPTQKQEAIAHVRRTESQVDTFYTPALFNEPLARREHFKASYVSWVEFDGSPNFGGHKPSLRIQSSGPGYEHWYYRMVTPIDSIVELEHYNKALAYTLGADYGWAANKLLRPVGTANHKYDSRPVVSVLNVFPQSWPKGELDAGWEDPTQSIDLTEKPLVLPPVAEVILKYAWPDRAAEMFQWPSCPPGTRSDSLMSLGYYCAEMGMKPEEMMAVLIHADDRWGKFKHRHDRIARLNEIIQRAKHKFPDETSQDSDVLGQLIQSNVLGGWMDILKANVTFDWLIENFWLQDTNLVMIGRQNVGKTQVSMRFGMNLALGRDKYLGYKINRQLKVLFLSLELGIVPIKLLTVKMSTGLTDEEKQALQERFISAPIGESIRLYTALGQESLLRLLDLVQPNAVIIDSLGKTIASPSNEEQAIEAANFLNKLNNKGVSFWGIHHQRKVTQGDKVSSPELDDAYGNQYITAFSRAAYGLYDLGTGLRLKQLKNNFAPQPDKVVALERTSALDFRKTGEIDEEHEKATQEKPTKLFGE